MVSARAETHASAAASAIKSDAILFFAMTSLPNAALGADGRMAGEKALVLAFQHRLELRPELRRILVLVMGGRVLDRSVEQFALAVSGDRDRAFLLARIVATV